MVNNSDEEDGIGRNTSYQESSSITSPENPERHVEDGKYLVNKIINTREVPSLIAQSINNAISINADPSQEHEMPKSLTEQIDLDPIIEEIIAELKKGSDDLPDCLSSDSQTPARSPGAAHVPQPVDVVAEKEIDENLTKDTILTRLRPRKEGQRLSALLESPKRAYTKRRSKVADKSSDNQIEIISNEPFTGPLPEFVLSQEQPQFVYVLKTDGVGTATASIVASTPTSMHQPGTVYLNRQPFLIASSSTPNQLTTANTAASISFTDDIPLLIQPSMCLTTTSSLNPGTIINTSDLQTPIVVHNEVAMRENAISAINVPTSESSVIVVDSVAATVANSVQNEKNLFSAVETIKNGLENVEFASNDNKIVPSTPRQPINPSIQASSRCRSTPRHRTGHVRVLDFNTPLRMKMQCAKIIEEESKGKRLTLRIFLKFEIII